MRDLRVTAAVSLQHWIKVSSHPSFLSSDPDLLVNIKVILNNSSPSFLKVFQGLLLILAALLCLAKGLVVFGLICSKDFCPVGRCLEKRTHYIAKSIQSSAFTHI